MLEEKDLLAIKSIVNDAMTNMEDSLNKRITESENLILNYVDDTRKTLEKQIQQVQKNLDELNQYYRITKLENDNTSLLLKMVQDLSKRIDELEQRTA